MHVSLGRGGAPRQSGSYDIWARLPRHRALGYPHHADWSQPDRIKNALGRGRVELSVGRSPVGGGKAAPGGTTRAVAARPETPGPLRARYVQLSDTWPWLSRVCPQPQ